MEYSHVVMHPGMCAPDFQAKFRDHLAFLAQYHYYQDIDWFMCNADAGFELLATYRGNEIVASSVLRMAESILAPRPKCIILNGPLARDNASLSIHLQGLLELLCGRAVDSRISTPLVKDSINETDMLMAGSGFSAHRCNSGNYTSTVTVDLTKGTSMRIFLIFSATFSEPTPSL